MRAYATLVGIVGILSFSDFVAGKVSNIDNGFSFTYGPGTALYLFPFILGIGYIVRNLLLDKNQLNDNGKKQAKIVAVGFVVAFLVGLLLSLVLPSFSNSTKLDDFTPFSLVIFLSFTGYAKI